MSASLGKHLAVEFYDCDRWRLDDEALLRRESVAAVGAMRATVVEVYSHRFVPYGVSVVVLLRESHLTLHTWPEHGTASLDVFVCGPSRDPRRAAEYVGKMLQATRAAEFLFERGQAEPPAPPVWREARPVSR
jgi:S-adenosylmethionine decarboxylase